MPPLAMADDTALGLSQEDLKAIDSVRARLFQLANSIGRLKGNVLMSDPMPTPESIQASAFVLQQNLASLNEVMAQHAELFRRIVVHPDPMFPGRTEEQVLTSLLRKKLEPEVEQVAETARATAAARGIGAASFLGSGVSRRPRGGGDDDDDDDDDDEDEDDEDEDDDDEDESDDDNHGPREPLGLGDIWAEARAWCAERIEAFIREEASDPYTKREREEVGVEHVRTGLQRSLEDDDEDDDDEDEDDDDDEHDNEKDTVMLDGGVPQTAAPAVPATAPIPTGPPTEPEVLLWLAARGDTDLPRYVDIELRKAQAAAAAAQRR